MNFISFGYFNGTFSVNLVLFVPLNVHVGQVSCGIVAHKDVGTAPYGNAVKDSMRRNHASDDSGLAGVSLFVFIADGGDCARVGDVFREHGLDIVHGT